MFFWLENQYDFQGTLYLILFENIIITYILFSTLFFSTDWEVIFDGKDGSTDPNYELKDNILKIRQEGFCRLCWTGWCSLNGQILSFIDRNLQRTTTVTLAVYAVKDHDANVGWRTLFLNLTKMIIVIYILNRQISS